MTTQWADGSSTSKMIQKNITIYDWDGDADFF